VIATNVLLETSLSFFGLGVKAPTPISRLVLRAERCYQVGWQTRHPMTADDSRARLGTLPRS
jgi:hypothetical protein